MTKETTGANKPDVQDDHAPSKIGPDKENTSKERGERNPSWRARPLTRHTTRARIQ